MIACQRVKTYVVADPFIKSNCFTLKVEPYKTQDEQDNI
jgi:hypothetical protein